MHEGSVARRFSCTGFRLYRGSVTWRDSVEQGGTLGSVCLFRLCVSLGSLNLYGLCVPLLAVCVVLGFASLFGLYVSLWAV